MTQDKNDTADFLSVMSKTRISSAEKRMCHLVKKQNKNHPREKM